MVKSTLSLVVISVLYMMMIYHVCRIACESGNHGEDCVEDCGNCKSGYVCDSFSGNCPDGCQAGWWTDMCKKGKPY